MGSPPQVRGKLITIKRLLEKARITPAGAGKTHGTVTAAKKPQDHPRRCGENRLAGNALPQARGSPPQVRGKPPATPKSCTVFRITPAGAGKTSCCCIASRITRDHPRRCGENRCRCLRLQLINGSPPQVRGKRGYSRGNAAILGITPAGAGKTSEFIIVSHLWQDHPRRCGENDVRLRKFDPVPGSPPQVRGKHIVAGRRSIDVRITPAGAGKTWFFRPSKQKNTDHPRRCGENRP